MYIGNFTFGFFSVLCIFGCSLAVPFSLFFPSGEDRGDRVLRAGDDVSSDEIALQTPIAYYDDRYSSIFVSLCFMSLT